MDRKIEVSVDEVLQVFLVLEDLVDLLHQPLNYERETIEKFTIENGGYRRVADLYYEVVLNWLPDDVKQALEDR